MIDFPDGTVRREQELCRARLEEAKARYSSERTENSRNEYRRALKAFSDAVMKSDMPRVSES